MPIIYMKGWSGCEMLSFIEYLNLPTKIGLVLVGLLLILQVIGELLEFKGKIVPEFMKIRKYFLRKKTEKKETAKTLADVKTLLQDVNAHYSSDNIAKRDSWMQWVNGRAIVYDNSIGEIGKISENLTNVTQALKDCTKMTEELFVQSSRDRIIDFASKVSNTNALVSREEFNRIFKVYDKYENFLEEHEMTNGEIDVAYQIIKESYEDHMKNHTFLEDVRGYSF